jgi:hypothetical protein
VHALTEQQVRRSFVNCSQGEAMCLLCQTAQTGDAVALFTARRTGAAGRNGNTVAPTCAPTWAAPTASGRRSRRGCSTGTRPRWSRSGPWSCGNGCRVFVGAVRR